MESKRRIIISSGYHATNIGNAFYDLGATYVLKKTIGEHFEIILSSDKMSLYWNRIVGANSFDHTLFYNADFLILMGPVFSANYIKIWATTLERLKARGTKLVFMSAGGEAYDDCERREVTEYLKKIMPYALLSRDRETYDTYNSFFEKSYDGICCALYCSDYAQKYRLDMEKYIVLNFDNDREPILVPDKGGSLAIGDLRYNLQFDKRMRGRRLDERLPGGETIIRTIHTVFPNKAKWQSAGYYISDIPYDYLNLYANAEAVITNRVHAAVPSLAYGTPVFLANKTPRGSILRRIQCEGAYHCLYKSQLDSLDVEKRNYEEAIKEIFV